MARSDALVETLSNIVAQHPFFAVILYDMMEIEEKPDLVPPTAATNGKTIYIHPEYFNGLSLAERVFLICHEALHAVFQHMPRSKGYTDRGFGPDLKPWDHGKFNRAADYVINDILGKSNVGTMPEGGLHRPDVSGDDLVDDVYCRLPDDKPPKGKKNSQGSHGGFDEHLHPEPGTEMPSDAEVKRVVQGAKNAAKAMGKMPGALERLVDEIVEPTQSWKELLRSFLTATSGHDTATWTKPNRRRLATAPHLIMPGSTGFQTGGVAIVVDTSGSVSDAELRQFMGEVASILSECKPEWCKVLWTDARVQHVDDVSSADELLDLKAHGGGGTDMGAAFKYMARKNIHPECCVVLTDGYTPWGDEQEYRVLWGITNEEIQSPHGQSIYINVR